MKLKRLSGRPGLKLTDDTGLVDVDVDVNVENLFDLRRGGH